MAFLANNKFKEILNASRNGNEKAKMIIQALRKGQTQDDVNRLVDAYYDIDEESIDLEAGMPSEPITEPQGDATDASIAESEEDDVIENVAGSLGADGDLTEQDADRDKESFEPTRELLDESEITPEEVVETEEVGEVEEGTPEVVDLTDVLNAETDGLFDEDEYTNVSFYDFLKNKKSDAKRAMKNADYFKAFDMGGRGRYADGLVDAYRQKFDGNLRDIERNYDDNDRAISTYLQSTNDMLDDGVEFGMESATNAYNDLIDNERAMGAFGRYWDDNDSNEVITALKDLVKKYGKANVISALNVIKGDNEAHRDYLNNAIDANISKYTKGVYGLLK